MKNNLVKPKQKTGVSLVGEIKISHPITGEVLPVAIVQKNIPKDYNFHKIWLQDILHILDSFGNKKIKVLTYLLSKMRNEDNSITITQTKISKDTGISRPTISETIKELIAGDVLRKDPEIPNLYRFNPSLIVKGSADKRRALITLYNYGDDNQEITIQEEKKLIEDISKKIATTAAAVEDKKVIDVDLVKNEMSIIEKENKKNRLEAKINVDEHNKTIEKELIINEYKNESDKKKKLIGILSGKIGDIDAKEVRKEMIEASIKKYDESV